MTPVDDLTSSHRGTPRSSYCRPSVAAAVVPVDLVDHSVPSRMRAQLHRLLSSAEDTRCYFLQHQNEYIPKNVSG
jgi:hypothetical protein